MPFREFIPGRDGQSVEGGQPLDNDRKATVEIFDSPLCCPTGRLCGPVVDPALLDISEALLRIQKEFGDRLKVGRYLLNQQPEAFLENEEVALSLRRDGIAMLPITTVGGKVVKTSAYPTYEELKDLIASSVSRDGGHEERPGSGIERKRK